MIIAISDLHLGSQASNKVGFSDFIRNYLIPNQDDISRIVLLGDVLDLWRNSNSKVLLQNLDVLAELGRLDTVKNYLVGNHDYAIFRLLNQSQSSIPPDSTGVLDNVEESLELTYDGLKLKFLHGHQIPYWSALMFYETFCQAMCFVDSEEPELADVWSIINEFTVDLPDSYRIRIEGLSQETRVALERKLAGPIDGNLEAEKTGHRYEWDLLTNVSNFEEVADRSGQPLKAIEEFARDWENILKTIDIYSAFPLPPPHIEREVHESRRRAADLTVGLNENQFLIRGHGHIPYVNHESKVADAGCWLGTKASFVLIIDGEVTVNRWPE